jgi:hypothetical protein
MLGLFWTFYGSDEHTFVVDLTEVIFPFVVDAKEYFGCPVNGN